MIVRTTNVDRVQATTRQLDQLIREGVVLQDYTGPSYIFTKLNEVLAGDHRRGHRQRPHRRANSSPTTPMTELGGIRSATQGSFEILGRDAIGFDAASQVFKKLRVVTTVSYQLR